jgi:hypothetical protein
MLVRVLTRSAGGRILAILIAISPFGVAALVGCGPSPDPAVTAGPTGTLVVLIRTGPDRVPFRPKQARIQQANGELAAILGHSITIEVDGALFPQTQDGAEDVIAHLVEDAARDLDELSKENATRAAIPFARGVFERLVVRYAPAEAAAREDRWGRGPSAKLDAKTKTIDVVRAEASFRALERGEIASAIEHAMSASEDERYARVMPDALPRGQQRAWFEYHRTGGHSGAPSADGAVGTVNPRRVRGMVLLHRIADPALATDVRKWLVNAMNAFSSAYQDHPNEVEAQPAGSPFRLAESDYVGWVKAMLPQMTLEERGEIARRLWVFDFRKDSGVRDRFAAYAFPGLDPMAFSFATVDAWIAAGHPPVGNARSGPPSTREVGAPYDIVVGPAFVEDAREGEIRIQDVGRSDGIFYRWALADRAREDAFVKGLLARSDEPLALAAFLGIRRALREESDYLRILRRFEGSPMHWRAGADVHREGVYRPSPLLLDESRRLWREVPMARGHVLLWFARHADGSYHPESDWPDLLQDTGAADESAFRTFLDLGWPAFELLPAAWPGVARRPFRVPLITAHARPLLDAGIRARPGGLGVAGVLAATAQKLCDEHAMKELAELGAWAKSELAARPGAGLSDVVAASDPSKCVPTHAPAASLARPRRKPKTTKSEGPEPDFKGPFR